MAVRTRSRTPLGVAANTDEIPSLIVKREQARQLNDLRLADQIRDQLEKMGVTLLDKVQQWRAARTPTATVGNSAVRKRELHVQLHPSRYESAKMPSRHDDWSRLTVIARAAILALAIRRVFDQGASNVAMRRI